MYTQLGNERDSLLRKFRRVNDFYLLPVLLLLLIFIFLNETILNQQTNQTEVGMGGPWSWDDLLMTYFALGDFPKRMRDKAPYRGAHDPQVSMTRCQPKDAPLCSQICSNRRHTESSSESKVCIYTDNERVRQCWETRHMRCWNSEHGGNDVYDGAYEWTLLRHVIETEFDIAWMHLRSSERRMDFFVFSSAFRNDKRSTVNEICTRLITAHSVQIRFSMIPKDHVAVLSGHDEGSGWALCGNTYLSLEKFPQMRRVIVTGALLTDPRLSYEIEEDLRVNGKVLLAATTIPSLMTPSGLLPDVFLLFNQAGVTLPQFGYACVEDREDYDISCIDPQPQINLADGLKRVNSMAGVYMLYDIHSFEFYRRCFYACLAVFQRKEETFSFNIRSYAKEITPVEGSEIAEDLQRPDENTFGGTGAQVPRPNVEHAFSSDAPGRMQTPAEWREAYGSDHTTPSDDELQEIHKDTQGFYHPVRSNIEPLDLHGEKLPAEIQEYQRPLTPENTFQKPLTPENVGASALRSETPDSISDVSEDTAVVQEAVRLKKLLSRVDFIPDSDASQADSSQSESTYHTARSPSEPESSNEHK